MKTIGIVGYSGVGKTTLLCGVIPYLRAAGLQVAAIKATHHDVRWDTPGKDSYRLQEAGAEPVLLAGAERWYLSRVAAPGDWDALLATLQPQPDLVLSEGHQDWRIPRLLVHRSALGQGLRWQVGDPVVAVVSDEPTGAPWPHWDLNAPDAVARALLNWYGDDNGSLL